MISSDAWIGTSHRQAIPGPGSCLLNIIPVLLTVFSLIAPRPADARSPQQKYPVSPSETNVNYAKRALQGFDMRVWISNQMTIGQQVWDGGIPPIGLEYPLGSGIEHVFGGGPWIGGIVDGARRVSEGYNGDNANKYIRPDPRHPLRELIWRTSVADSLTEPNRRGCDDDGDGKIDEDDLDGLDNDGDWTDSTDDVGIDGIADIIETGCQGGYDAVTNPDPAFDNYERYRTDQCHPDANGNYRKKDDPDAYTEKNGIPDHGEPNVDEDYGAISDNDLYCSASDRNDPPAGHYPMEIKVIQKVYAWRDPSYGAIIPFDYYFINEGTKTIEDVYVGYFLDADVGPVNSGDYYNRNYTCYIDTLRTAYAHNPIDRGSTPIGITVLGTPKPLNELKYIYQWFDFTTRFIPSQDDSTLYSWMSGVPFPDNLIAICQSPTNPSDTRFLLSFGPFESFAPGETLKISIALVSGFGVESGPNNLKENAGKALLLHERMKNPGAVLPRAVPPSPELRFAQADNGVRLDWAHSSGGPDPLRFWDLSNGFAETFSPGHWRRSDPPCEIGGDVTGCGALVPCDSSGGLPGGRIFEGYRLYRSEHQGENPHPGSFTKIREYDIPGDGVGFDFGLDTAFVDSNLQVGRRYWYAVTSFGIPDMNIVPRPGPSGGVVYDTNFTPGIESNILDNVVKVDASFRTSDRLGEVLVVPNPYRVDHDYTSQGGGWEGNSYDWTDFKRKIRFIHLPRKCTIRIYTVAGDVITTLNYESPPGDPDEGQFDWRLVTESKRPLASGLYVFTVESEYGTQYGKFVVIR
ncbi:MAG TPA: hypothetical protein VI932_04860 [Bacteroidota bacterium]|nr:hypothetical protein [Bacteroidota bacterium]